MQMKKTCIIKNIALDDVDEKTCKKNSSLENEDEKNSIVKNIVLQMKKKHVL